MPWCVICLTGWLDYSRSTIDIILLMSGERSGSVHSRISSLSPTGGILSTLCSMVLVFSHGEAREVRAWDFECLTGPSRWMPLYARQYYHDACRYPEGVELTLKVPSKHTTGDSRNFPALNLMIRAVDNTDTCCSER